MKKHILLFSLLCTSLVWPAVAQTNHNNHHNHNQHPQMQGAQPSGKSLYWLDGTWTNQQKKKLELKSLRGQIVVIAMIYSSCSSVCPLILEDVKKIEKSLSSADRGKVTFVLVSFDPQRDNPEKLAQYAQKQGVNRTNWHFLNGKASQVSELAALLGVRYQATAQGEFIHSNQITLLNAEGEVAYQRPDLKTDLSDFQKKLKSLLPPMSHQGHH
ncbi:MAG: SCO family protein [Candidatus Sericytochromatia bacterium]|jgi:protein SCO1/2|nr:SCO family protein [Candidatus Sericytochromatia bacterium]